MPEETKESSPVQTLVQLALDRRKMTRYQLSRLCGWAPHAIYRKLTVPTNHHGMERMLAAMGAEVKIGRAVLKLSLDGDGNVVGKITTKPSRSGKAKAG